MPGRLSRSRRCQVRAETRKFFLARGKFVSKEAVEQHIKTQFAGILGMIAISVAAQLAWYFIKRWLDQELAPEDVPDSYQPDEPGYEDNGES